MVCFQHDTHTLSKRCERRGVGLRRFDRLSAPRSLPDLHDRRRPAARLRAARGLERIALDRPRFGRLSATHGGALAHDAQRSAAVVHRLSANPALAEGRGRCDASTGSGAALVHDRRTLLREIEGRVPAPRAAIVDARTMPSTLPAPPQGGKGGGAARAGYDGHQRPPLTPRMRGGQGGERSTWLKRFITFMLEST